MAHLESSVGAEQMIDLPDLRLGFAHAGNREVLIV